MLVQFNFVNGSESLKMEYYRFLFGKNPEIFIKFHEKYNLFSTSRIEIFRAYSFNTFNMNTR
jgi:hypothetical protein